MSLFTNPNLKAKDLKGAGLYYDNRKKRMVYCGPFMKNGYVINNDNVRLFSLFQMRYILVLVIALLIQNFTQNDAAGAISGIILLIGAELLFRLWFLPSLQMLPDFKKPDKENVITRTSSLSYSSLILTIIISAAFGVWYFFYTKNTDYTAFVKILNYLVICIPLYLGGLHLVALFHKISHKN